MPVSAHDVAAELRRRLPHTSDVAIHKLLYYAQGWHLVATGAPLFPEVLEAWANGPAVAALWAEAQRGRWRPPPKPLGDAAVATVDYVVARYGDLTGTELIRRTHVEDPWRDVSERDDLRLGPTPEITPASLLTWFTQDDDLVARRDELERLRAHRDVYRFGPLPLTVEVRAAVARAHAGERVRPARLA